MECKVTRSRRTLVTTIGINRNILECKGICDSSGSSPISVLIETYWSVKLHPLHGSGACRKVLIETYWNVKDISLGGVIRPAWVLIETYWNVKKFAQMGLSASDMVLIETYWNVKGCHLQTVPAGSPY